MVPGFLWLAYFFLQGRRRPGSFHLVLKVFLWGALCTIPAGFAEQITDARVEQETLLRSAIVGLFLIAPIEEFFKLLAVWVSVYRTRHFREPFHGLLYSVTAALGFACVENVIYMGFLGPEIFWLRAVFATPAHLMFSAMWGYAMGIARFRRRGELLTVTKGFLAATALHGAYNFLVAVRPSIAVITLIPLMGFMAWLTVRVIRDSRTSYPFPPIGSGPLVTCPTCWAYTPLGQDYCSRCGAAMGLIATDAPRYCGKCRAMLDPNRDQCPRCGEEVCSDRVCTGQGHERVGLRLAGAEPIGKW